MVKTASSHNTLVRGYIPDQVISKLMFISKEENNVAEQKPIKYHFTLLFCTSLYMGTSL